MWNYKEQHDSDVMNETSMQKSLHNDEYHEDPVNGPDIEDPESERDQEDSRV